ncbi:MAG: right-handed parallel beta-helix repeat-containing protein [Thiolinea sp.]
MKIAIRMTLLPWMLALVVGGLGGCDDETLDEIVDEFYEDMDYSYEVIWPTQNNSACPAWGRGQTISISESMQLPPRCVFEQVTININRSDVDFDCNQAVFNGITERVRHEYGDSYRPAENAPWGTAFRIRNAETATNPLQNITIRNCQITNYIHGVDVALNLSAETRAGLRAGTVNEDTLRAKAPANIRVLNTHIINTHGSGVFIYPYVTDFQFLNSHIKGAGGPGLYLDAGSRASHIENSVFEGNGFSSYSTETMTRSARRSDDAKREGIAIDSSTQHLIRNNFFQDNGDGGIYLYKNCWENAETRPNEVPRTEGANLNRIEGNRFQNETTGVWLAERADRDLSGFNCGDPLIYEEDGKKYYRDQARENVVADNRFENMRTGVRVMDDANTVRGNVFVQTEHYDIDVGSRTRELINDPVSGTVVDGNTLSKPNGIQIGNCSQ